MSARDRLFLSPHWHVDCRLVAELPEDSVVGIRFITYAISIAIAIASLLFTGWYSYADISLRQQIEDANKSLEDSYWDVAEVRRIQRFYEVEAKKIESAYKDINNPIFFSAFISEMGKILPNTMVIDLIDYGDTRTVVRGRLHEDPESASQTLGAYVVKLRNDPAVGSYFSSINITALQRSSEDEQIMTFEVTFHFKPRTP